MTAPQDPLLFLALVGSAPASRPAPTLRLAPLAPEPPPAGFSAPEFRAPEFQAPEFRAPEFHAPEFLPS